MSAWAILAAAGAGRRAGGELPKQLWDLAGTPVLVRAARPFSCCERIEGLVVVAPRLYLERVEALLAAHGLPDARVVPGGETRAESVRLGLDALPPACTVVAVHDAARPFVQVSAIVRVIEEAEAHGAALLAVPVADTLKRGDAAGGVCQGTVPRAGLWAAQTPQAFRTALLARAYREAGREAASATDEAALVEALGVEPVIVEGDRRNFKLTGPEDRDVALALAAVQDREGERRLSERINSVRVGHGIDAHRFAHERPLVLGGVRLRERDGLLGHSDADVLTHAVTDALLGAVGAEDLGAHFPDTDPRYAGACSLDLLRAAVQIARARGFVVHQADATVIAEEPRLAPRREEMRMNLAVALGVEPGDVSIKATTTEGMGFTGRREGIAALATVLVGRGEQERDPR